MNWKFYFFSALIFGQVFLLSCKSSPGGADALDANVSDTSPAPASGAAEIPATDPGLIGLWHLNNSTADATTNNNTGFVRGDATFTTNAKVGSHAASFDGDGDFIRIRAHTGIPDGEVTPGEIVPANNYTITAWISFNQTELTKDIFGAGGRMSFGITADNKLYYSEYPYHYGNEPTVSSTTLTPNEWHHVAITKSSTEGIVLYVDGVSVAGAPGATGDWFTNEGGNGNAIGYNGNPSYLSSFFSGYIDEFALYSRALSASEMAQQYSL